MTEDELWDAMTTAVVEDDLPTINRCLAEGVDVKATTSYDKWNLLHLALNKLTEPPVPAVVKRLIDAGVDVNAPDSTGWTPLHFAARAGSAEAVQLLLDAGAQVNVPDNKGITPLHRAVIDTNELPPLEAMLIAGADPNLSFEGVSASNYIEAVEVPDFTDVRRLMAKYKKPKRAR